MLMRQELVETTRDILETLYAKYNHRHLIKPDPLQFVYCYSSGADMEIVALLASCLAYGRVRQIGKDLAELFSRIGPSPCEFVMSFDKNSRRKLDGFKHRFNCGDDIATLMAALRLIFEQYASLEEFFLEGYDDTADSVAGALSAFSRGILKLCAQNRKGAVPASLAYLLPDPTAGSCCKRLNLFLRWMVRDDEVDVGLWKSVDTSKLLVPVDTHMARLCKILGLYERKTVSLRAAVEITRSFAQIEPADPVKYDFALSRIGIIEDCNGRYRPRCEDCELLGFCRP